MKCDCGHEGMKQQGTYRKDGILLPRFQCLGCDKFINSGRKYRRLNPTEIELIIKMRKNKMELRKIAKVFGVNVNTVAYHLKKNT